MSGDLTPAYYIIGIAGTIGTGLLATRSYMSKTKDRWLAEGGKAVSLSEKITANTAAATKNTEAIEALSKQIGQFAAQTTERINGHDKRIGRVEDAVFEPRRKDPT